MAARLAPYKQEVARSSRAPPIARARLDALWRMSVVASLRKAAPKPATFNCCLAWKAQAEPPATRLCSSREAACGPRPQFFALARWVWTQVAIKEGGARHLGPRPDCPLKPRVTADEAPERWTRGLRATAKGDPTSSRPWSTRPGKPMPWKPLTPALLISGRAASKRTPRFSCQPEVARSPRPRSTRPSAPARTPRPPCRDRCGWCS
jgi:hypothetical protein